tara:strand:+ start:729 stop:2714 length:1986 start_codon:yes stop_codon:yes gene_type:complete
MTTLYLDLETFCTVPITHGTHAYAEKAEILLLAYAVDDAPVEVIDFMSDRSDPPVTPYSFLSKFLRVTNPPDEIVIHNAAFDATVLYHHGVEIPPEKTFCTMAWAFAHGLPGSLDLLCDVLKVPQDMAKLKSGKRLVHLFTKPQGSTRKVQRATRETHPEEWAEFVEYARRDVEAMRVVRSELPLWNYTPAERQIWRLDQIVNNRGVAVDLELAKHAVRAMAVNKHAMAERTKELTDGELGACTQRDALLTLLKEKHNLPLENLQKATVAELLKGPLTDEVRDLLETRQQSAGTSTTKYQTLLKGASSDGRLKGLFQYCGAMRTGRWGGRLFQPQNLARATLKHHEIENGIRALKLEAEDMIVPNIPELCTSAMRGSIIAPKGKKLIVADLSNIEGRKIAWLAGETWKVKAFQDFDKGIGFDTYIAAYARAMHVSPESVIENKKTGDGKQRQIGKVMELALGFGGAVGAFTTMAATYGVEIPEDEVLTIVRAWRKAHPRIVAFWYDLERAAKVAIRDPKTTTLVNKIEFSMRDGYLRMRLPSGRYLCYPNASVDDIDDPITYDGFDTYTHKWGHVTTWGGKLAENATQASSRDVLAYALLRAEREGYSVVLHVHDEIVAEVPDTTDYTAAKLSELMCVHPSWAVGLPLAAVGFETHRYRKE